MSVNRAQRSLTAPQSIASADEMLVSDRPPLTAPLSAYDARRNDTYSHIIIFFIGMDYHSVKQACNSDGFFRSKQV